MKTKFSTLMVLFLLITTTACAPLKSMFQPTPTPAPVTGTGGEIIPPAGITLADNGRTFVMRPGDEFLLNLGMETYEWSPTVNNQSVLSRVMNIAVIRGAQGIYAAHIPGTAVLTATGDPLCRQSTPACMAPSIIFRITLIVRN
jgi:hypothetical protein